MINIRHTGRVVSNLEESLKFYVDLLGMKIINKGRLDRYDTLKLLGIEDCDLTYVKLGTEFGETLLELYYFENVLVRTDYFENQQNQNITFEHVAFTVKNAKELHQLLLENEIDVLSASTSIDSDCSHELFFARDPDGNLLEFVEKL